MRHFKNLLGILIFGVLIFELATYPKWMPLVEQQKLNFSSFGKIENTLSSELAKYLPKSLNGKLVAESSQQEIIKKKTNQQDLSNSTTPIESIVKGVPLANTYYYSFAEGTPNSVKQVFSLAIATYNNTGIVKLVPGTGEAGQNTVVFSTYYTTEDDPDVQQSTEELGKGGPEIFKSSISSYNHGRALINLQYPDEAISQAVATHELGHALGLGHSKDPQSVMYPMDKGMTALTQNDINTLHAIYD